MAKRTKIGACWERAPKTKPKEQSAGIPDQRTVALRAFERLRRRLPKPEAKK